MAVRRIRPTSIAARALRNSAQQSSATMTLVVNPPVAPDEADVAHVAIVIVAYQGLHHLRAVLESCRTHASTAVTIVVDNGSTDGGPELVATEFPETLLIRQRANLGFAGGCNVGIRIAKERHARWVLLLNQDAVVEEGTVAALAAFLDSHARAAAVQPALFRGDGLVNSLGNPMHYLGFSAAGGNGLTVEEAERDPTMPWLHDSSWRTAAVEVPVCSGAALMLKMAALDEVGLLEEELFLYQEDLELALRLRRAGWSLHLLGAVRARHNYAFSRNPLKWYFLERNRHWVLLAHYRARSLALLAVPFAGVEAALWLLAIRQGWAGERLQAYRYWLIPGKVGYLRKRRREIAGLGARTDGDLLSMASARFTATELASPLIERVFNPASTFIWWLLRPLLLR